MYKDAGLLGKVLKALKRTKPLTAAQRAEALLKQYAGAIEQGRRGVGQAAGRVQESQWVNQLMKHSEADYITGFFSKCAEYGLSEKQAIEWAEATAAAANKTRDVPAYL